MTGPSACSGPQLLTINGPSGSPRPYPCALQLRGSCEEESKLAGGLSSPPSVALPRGFSWPQVMQHELRLQAGKGLVPPGLHLPGLHLGQHSDPTGYSSSLHGAMARAQGRDPRRSRYRACRRQGPRWRGWGEGLPGQPWGLRLTLCEMGSSSPSGTRASEQGRSGVPSLAGNTGSSGAEGGYWGTLVPGWTLLGSVGAFLRSNGRASPPSRALKPASPRTNKEVV